MRKVKALINWITSTRVIAVLLLLMQAWIQWLGATALHQTWRHGVVAGCGLGVAALAMRKSWGNLIGAAVLAGLCLIRVYAMSQKAFTLNGTLMAATMAYFAWAVCQRPDSGIIDDFTDAPEPEKEAEEDDEPLISLVQLRTQPRYLEVPVLANALSEAWDLNISADEDVPDDAHGFVTGEGPIYIVAVTKPRNFWFMVHNHDAPYFDDPDDLAASVPNRRFAEIIRTHGAWLSVDLMRAASGDADQIESCRMIGKAIASLADDDTQALLCPQHNYFNLWSPDLEKELCGPSPLEVFKKEVKAPVIGVQDADIKEAIAEARRRWPEFVAAFSARKPGDDRFIVKAPFLGEDGETEHMWISVFALEPEYVHGHLMNEPFHSKKLKQGAQVEVPVGEISDWLCPDANDHPIGNFTQRAVKAAQKSSPA